MKYHERIPLIPEPLDQLARQQFSLVTRAQVLAVMSRSQLQRRLDRGILVRVYPGVYRFPGSAPSFRQRALAVCLAVGPTCAVSHLAAARLMQVTGAQASQVEITVPRARTAGAALVLTHRRPLPQCDLTQRWSIPVTAPARTVIDLSRMIDPGLLRRIFDELLRTRQLTEEQLLRRLSSEEPLPRYSSATLNSLLLGHTPVAGRGHGDSPPEDWVFDTIVAAGLPVPVRHYIVVVDGEIRELDMAYPEMLIAIEYDGWTIHADRSHFHKDREKVSALQLLGWIVLQVTSGWTAELLVERVRRAIAVRCA